MRTVPPGWGAGMRWAGWLLLGVGAVACGGGHAIGADPDAGTGSIVVPDAGSGGSDAGAPADCTGLVPTSIGQAYAVDVTTATANDVCAFTTSDAHGVIATQTGGGSWGEYASSGKTGSFSTTTPEIFPQSTGFVGLYGTNSLIVAAFGEGGEYSSIATGGQAGMVALAPVDGDGILVFTADSSTLSVRRLDAALVEVAKATVTGSFVPRSGALDASGAVLALTGSGNAVSGMWIDLAHGTAGAPFAIGTATQIAAVPLLGGGVAIQLDGRWAALLQPGQSTLNPPPAWLRDGAQVAVVRSGAAYALVPATGNAVDIVSPQGNACGTVTFSGANTLAIGRGGAVIGSTGARSCTKIFWQNALR